MNEKYVCGICGKEYSDLNAYLTCVFKCGSELQAKREAENQKYLKEVNDALSKVKEAKELYEKKLNEFKEKYPKEYELNFGKDECCDCIFEEDEECDTESFEFSYEDNGKDTPKLSAKINGKEVQGDALKKLYEDPDTKYLAKLLGIL